MNIKTKVWTGITISLLILVASGYSSYIATQYLITTTERVAHTHEVEKSLESVISQLKDAETGQRGYLLTNDSSYLAPYESGKANIQSLIDKTKRLIADSPDQIERIEQLSVLAEAKLNELQETVELYKSGNQAAALKIVLTHKGKLLMDEIRAIIDVMESEQVQILTERQKASESAIRNATFISSFGHLLVFIIIGAIALTIGHDSSRYITERIRAEEQLSFHASHDSLTGLVNRREFEKRAQRLLSSINQNHFEHALCYMDLDQFKLVNDACGHTAGDELLRQLSQLLINSIRHRDTLARLGGDEFGVLMEHCALEDAHRVAKTLLEVIQNFQFNWKGQSFRLGASIGLVAITDETQNLTDLLKAADVACYIAKDSGRNRIHVYHFEDAEITQRHGEMQWVTRINQAFEENRFCLYAQSIVPLDRHIDKHCEVLLRMVDAEGGIVSPNAFLPAAERYNLITDLDRWVIENTFMLLSANPDFLKHVELVSINLSGQSITDNSFLKFIISQLDEAEIKTNSICFEITETAAISNLQKATKLISTLKELGCKFALDDFGSGLSSFAYLKNLDVDFLKIDGMFVKDIVHDQIDHSMVKSINEIGKVMGMQTIAEFVENDEIIGMLRELGVDYVQGYGVHKPQPFVDLMVDQLEFNSRVNTIHS